MNIPKSNDLFVDTSGWAYYIDKQDPLHSVVVKHVRHLLARRGFLVTTNYVIAELVALLSSRYNTPRQQLVMIINSLRQDQSIKILHVDQDFDSEAWKLLEARLDKEWSLVDASSFVVMRRYGMTQALTSDHHFAQAGFTCIPGHTTRGSRS
jgi:predicted nucleic acid-binding protein